MTGFKQRLADLFDDYPELQRLKQLLQQNRVDAWLVGGTLRDLLLDRPVVDIDIAVAGDPTPAARAWAQKTRGRWFWLDSERKQSRVLFPQQLIVDFAPLRAATIAEDQALRDYTVNSLAVSLTEEGSSPVLLDPLGGVTHLEQKRLELCSTRSLPDDPLRMLKGIRHAVTLPMTLSAQSLQQIKEQAGRIGSVAGERIRDELGKILSAADPVAGLELLYETGLLAELLGSGQPDWDAGPTFSALRRLNQQMLELETGIDAEPGLEEPFNSRALFLLATLLRAYAPADLSNLLNRKLRLSRQQQRLLINLQQPPGEPWFALADRVTTARQKALLVEQLGFFPDEQLLYWAVYRQLIALDRIRDLLQSYYAQQQLGRVPDLLNGHQLRDLLPGRPDKEIGGWQQRIKAAELTGDIVNRLDVPEWLKTEISD